MDTRRRSVTCVEKGDRLAVLPDVAARVTRVTTEPGWVRLDWQYDDGSREHGWWENHEGVELVK